jgi:hypothetical protein
MLWKLADGPMKVAGTPYVDAAVTTLGLDSRAFFGLAIGTSPADAQVVGNNLMPLRVVSPVSGRPARSSCRPSPSEVPAGQVAVLTVTPISDMSFGHGSRVPGAIVLDGTVVRLPVRP